MSDATSYAISEQRLLSWVDTLPIYHGNPCKSLKESCKQSDAILQPLSDTDPEVATLSLELLTRQITILLFPLCSAACKANREAEWQGKEGSRLFRSLGYIEQLCSKAPKLGQGLSAWIMAGADSTVGQLPQGGRILTALQKSLGQESVIEGRAALLLFHQQEAGDPWLHDLLIKAGGWKALEGKSSQAFAAASASLPCSQLQQVQDEVESLWLEATAQGDPKKGSWGRLRHYILSSSGEWPPRLRTNVLELLEQRSQTRDSDPLSPLLLAVYNYRNLRPHCQTILEDPKLAERVAIALLPSLTSATSSRGQQEEMFWNFLGLVLPEIEENVELAQRVLPPIFNRLPSYLDRLPNHLHKPFTSGEEREKTTQKLLRAAMRQLGQNEFSKSTIEGFRRLLDLHLDRQWITELLSELASNCTHLPTMRVILEYRIKQYAELSWEERRTILVAASALMQASHDTDEKDTFVQWLKQSGLCSTKADLDSIEWELNEEASNRLECVLHSAALTMQSSSNRTVAIQGCNLYLALLKLTQNSYGKIPDLIKTFIIETIPLLSRSHFEDLYLKGALFAHHLLYAIRQKCKRDDQITFNIEQSLIDTLQNFDRHPPGTHGEQVAPWIFCLQGKKVGWFDKQQANIYLQLIVEKAGQTPLSIWAFNDLLQEVGKQQMENILSKLIKSNAIYDDPCMERLGRILDLISSDALRRDSLAERRALSLTLHRTLLKSMIDRFTSQNRHDLSSLARRLPLLSKIEARTADLELVVNCDVQPPSEIINRYVPLLRELYEAELRLNNASPEIVRAAEQFLQTRSSAENIQLCRSQELLLSSAEREVKESASPETIRQLQERLSTVERNNSLPAVSLQSGQELLLAAQLWQSASETSRDSWESCLQRIMENIPKASSIPRVQALIWAMDGALLYSPLCTREKIDRMRQLPDLADPLILQNHERWMLIPLLTQVLRGYAQQESSQPVILLELGKIVQNLVRSLPDFLQEKEKPITCEPPRSPLGKQALAILEHQRQG